MDSDIIRSHERLVMLGGIDHQTLLFSFNLPFAFSQTCLHDYRIFLFACAVMYWVLNNTIDIVQSIVLLIRLFSPAGGYALCK